MSSAATERPAGGTRESRRARTRRGQRDRQRLHMTVAATVAVLVALLAGAVILLRLSSDSSRVSSPDSFRMLTPLTVMGGLSA